MDGSGSAAGGRTAGIVDLAKKRFTQNYRQSPIVLERGEGSVLWDVDGKRYLDCCAGIAVCVLGHSHPRLARAIAEQAGRLVHVSNLFYNPLAVRLADELCRRSGLDRAFFCNSGAEAIEAAIKLSRRAQAVARGAPERIELVAMEKSFHGRTVGALSLTGQPKYHAGFGPLLPGVRHVPFGDLDAARAAVGDRTAALFVEPVQGEGGVIPPPAGYLAGLRALTKERGALLVFDEIQTGMGRTGPLFAFQGLGTVPDIVVLAKGIAGGVPMGALLASEEAARGFEPGTHASTFGGNALACAAALATLETIDEEKLLDRARRLGDRLSAGLAAIAARHPERFAGERGLGMLRALVTTAACPPAKVVASALRHGLLLSVAGSDGVRFSPPLTIGEAEIDEALRLAEAAALEVELER